MQNDLLQYLRKKNSNQRVGILVARKVEKEIIFVGWSKCKLNADKFDVSRGKEIAEGRIQQRQNGRMNEHKVPHSIKGKVDEFVERAKRYFKTENVRLV